MTFGREQRGSIFVASTKTEKKKFVCYVLVLRHVYLLPVVIARFAWKALKARRLSHGDFMRNLLLMLRFRLRRIGMWSQVLQKNTPALTSGRLTVSNEQVKTSSRSTDYYSTPCCCIKTAACAEWGILLMVNMTIC